jgi:hypothetical protein
MFVTYSYSVIDLDQFHALSPTGSHNEKKGFRGVNVLSI